ncbi:MAG: nuclear transport factor 2 family protein [Campylobacterales bacterium]|nr:nuclear transport factor 2 family protein [Campylobacterales bacterium]
MTQERLSEFFESLSSDTSLEMFKEIYASKVHFKDPFHDVHDVADVYNIFQQMYQRLDNPTFKMIEYLSNQDVAYVRWKFIYQFKGESTLQNFVGVSRIVYDENGKISTHIDYWDAGEHIYEKLPLLGSCIRWIKRKIQNGHT